LPSTLALQLSVPSEVAPRTAMTETSDEPFIVSVLRHGSEALRTRCGSPPSLSTYTISAGPSPVTSYSTLSSWFGSTSGRFGSPVGRSVGSSVGSSVGRPGTSVGRSGTFGRESICSCALSVALFTSSTAEVTPPAHSSSTTATSTAISGALLRFGGGGGAAPYPGWP
jgi:hypothetical protein